MMTSPPCIVMFCLLLTSITHVSRGDEAPVTPVLPTVILTIELTDGSRIIGPPMELATLPVKLEFTQLEIPLHLLASAQFSADRKTFAVKFANNDTLTGTLELSQIKVKTTYGAATVPVGRIARLSIAAGK